MARVAVLALLWLAASAEPGAPPVLGSEAFRCDRPIAGVAFSPDGARVAVVGEGMAALLDASTGATVWADGRMGGTGVAWSPSGRSLAIRGRSWPGIVVDAETGVVVAAPGSGRETPGGGAFAWSPDGHLLARTAGVGGLEILDVATLSFAARSRAGEPEPGALALALSPDGALVATSGADGAGRVLDLTRILRPDLGLLDLATGAITPPPAVAEGPHRPPTALALSRDGKRAVAGYATGLLRLLDLP